MLKHATSVSLQDGIDADRGGTLDLDEITAAYKRVALASGTGTGTGIGGGEMRAKVAGLLQSDGYTDADAQLSFPEFAHLVQHSGEFRQLLRTETFDDTAEQQQSDTAEAAAIAAQLIETWGGDSDGSDGAAGGKKRLALARFFQGVRAWHAEGEIAGLAVASAFHPDATACLLNSFAPMQSA